MGKTRVVQEFYRRLAAAQVEDERYWPAMLTEDTTNDLRLIRKDVRPDRFDVRPGVRMPWLWWAVSCERRSSGEAAQVLADDITQLQAHLAFLYERQLANAAGRKAFRSTVSLVGSFLLPSVGDALAVGQAVGEVVRAGVRQRRARVLARDRTLDAADVGRHTLVGELVSLLELAGKNKRLPVIMVVDDAHDADESVIALLERIFIDSPTVPMLVVSSSRPMYLPTPGESRQEESFESRSLYGRWLTGLHERGGPSPTRRSLAPLDSASMDQIARFHIPLADAGFVSKLAEHACGNPLVLEGILEIPWLKRRLAQGTVDDPVDIPELPNTFQDILNERWIELPPDVQEAVGLAAIQGQAFSRELVLDSYDAIEHLRTRDGASALDRALDPHRWIRRAGVHLAFGESYAYALASEGIREVLGPDELREIAIELTARLAEKKAGDQWSELPDDAQRMLMELHVRLAEREDRASHRIAIVSAGESAYAISHMAADEGAPRKALGVARKAVSWLELLPDSDRRSCSARDLLASLLSDLGDVSEACELHAAVLDDLVAAHGMDDPDAIAARNNLAVTQARSGAGTVALALQREVLELSEQRLAPDAADVAVYRANLAVALSESGQDEAAAELLARMVNVGEGLAIETSGALRNNLAVVLHRLGRHPEAVAELTAVVGMRDEVFGSDHTATRAARRDLARALLADDHPHRAVAVLQRLLNDTENARGAQSPEALVVQGELAVSLSATGDHIRAVAEQTLVTTLMSEQAGPEDPAVLDQRSNLAALYHRAGEHASALSTQQEVVTALAALVDVDPERLTTAHRQLEKIRTAAQDV